MEWIRHIDALMKYLRNKRRTIIMREISRVQTAIIENTNESKRLHKELDRLYEMR